MKPPKIIIYLLLLCAFGKAVAQPSTLDKNIKPQELKLTDYKKGDSLMSGKINISKITQQTKDTAYFFVKGAGIYQRVVFSAANRKPNQTLDIALCKYSWNKPDRSGKVEGKKMYSEKFRTEGSFGIRVISKQRNPEYQLLVWVSDEPKKITMTNAFKQKIDKAKKK
jgi:hypothetical protein